MAGAGAAAVRVRQPLVQLAAVCGVVVGCTLLRSEVSGSCWARLQRGWGVGGGGGGELCLIILVLFSSSLSRSFESLSSVFLLL